MTQGCDDYCDTEIETVLSVLKTASYKMRVMDPFVEIEVLESLSWASPDGIVTAERFLRSELVEDSSSFDAHGVIRAVIPDISETDSFVIYDVLKETDVMRGLETARTEVIRATLPPLKDRHAAMIRAAVRKASSTMTDNEIWESVIDVLRALAVEAIHGS